MVAWIRFMPMALKHLTNPIVFWVRRRVGASPTFANKIFIPVFRGVNNTALKTRIALTFNQDKKQKLLAEEKKIVTDQEVITIGADIVGQLVAIAIGIVIIDVCDKWSKKTQEEYRQRVADQLTEYDARIDSLAEKCHYNNVRILVLEDELRQLKQCDKTKK